MRLGTVLLILLVPALALAQTETSTIVTDSGLSDVGALLEAGRGWAAAGAILGLLVRLARLVGLRNLLGPGAARIWAVVAVALLGVATGMAEGSLIIALEAIVAGVMGILGGEAAARRTEGRENS